MVLVIRDLMWHLISVMQRWRWVNHCSSPAWHSVSCYVESAHLLNELGEAEGPHGTQSN